jgi:chromosome segregation ATPase
MKNALRNTDDVIDSRDVIERIEELEDERQELVGAIDGAKDDLKDAQDDTSVLQTDAAEESTLFQKIGDAESALIDWDEEKGEELTALKNLADEGANESSEWSSGETLIWEDYFAEYAQQLVEDIGDLPSNIPGYIVIDWEQTAENLKVDYSTVDFDGETYYIRNS